MLSRDDAERSVCRLETLGRTSGLPREIEIWFVADGDIEREADETRARQLLGAKYQGWREGRPLSEWARDSLPVRIDLSNGES